MNRAEWVEEFQARAEEKVAREKATAAEEATEAEAVWREAERVAVMASRRAPERSREGERGPAWEEAQQAWEEVAVAWEAVVAAKSHSALLHHVVYQPSFAGGKGFPATFRPSDFTQGSATLTDDGRDAVESPAHYTQNRIECIECVEAMVEPWPGIPAALGKDVLKYLWRHRDKGEKIESLQKARWYLDRLIDHYEETEG